MKPFLPPLPPPSSPRTHTRAPGIAGAGESLALAEWHLQHQRPVLYLAKDALSAAHAAEELSFFAPEVPTRLLPDWETLPFSRTSPLSDLQTERMAALAALKQFRGIIVAAAPAALLPCPPPAFVSARNLRTGGFADTAALIAGLSECGYVRTDRVLAAGEFAVYGGQIDIFPPDADCPARLILEDDEIEQIRLFDPRTQRSGQVIPELQLFPAGECDLSSEGISRFRRAFVRRFGDVEDPVLEAVSQGKSAPGMEFLLPLFFACAARLPDYAAADALFVIGNGARAAMGRFMEQAQRRREHADIYERRAVLPAEEVFLPPDEFFERLQKFSTLEFEDPVGDPPTVAINRRRPDSHAALKEFLRTAPGRVLIAADSEGRRDSLHAALSHDGLQPRKINSFCQCRESNLSLAVAPLRGGFSFPDLSVLTEAEIFDIRLPPRKKRQTAAETGEPLTIGDAVAHRDYGIGRYAGIAEKTIGGQRGEFLQIDYADGQRLWLPAAHLHLLSPCHTEPTELSRLGGRKWHRTRARAEKNARDTAARLLAAQARRIAGGGIQHRPDSAALAKFADEFVHEETPDQAEACQAVLKDMQSPMPMDRVLVADVGFGKTEVAMRAACCAVLSGSQVAVLAPTTLLAEQHARTFADRFAGFPARIVSLTRLSGARDKKLAQVEIADGRADIAIGTHALLSKSVQFQRLGLVIIDEEHRFGVRQKEYFKTIRADADVLSLSATPIPRTMAMAMEGVRDISLISTPPPARLAVQTTVAPFSQDIIVDACEREMLRGGQIYFVHNDIGGLPEMEERLHQWLPEMNIVRAHGAMNAAEIEQAMRHFVRGEADMLLATSIVESGLDIANANTIIINRADRMGVSRLHQLRGRVGRAGAQARAFLLTPPEGAATAKGSARLSAVSDYGALGDGMFIALRDLETRGAGEIFGERQSGDLMAVGYAMYQKMVAAAVRNLNDSDESDFDFQTVVELPLPALLPADYAPSVNERLRYYRQLSVAKSDEEINATRLEWEDRFGKLPPSAHRLIACHKLRLLAGAAQAVRLRARDGQAVVEFAPDPQCREALLQKISEDKCRPGKEENTVIIDELDSDSLQCARQLTEFLRGLVH